MARLGGLICTECVTRAFMYHSAETFFTFLEVAFGSTNICHHNDEDLLIMLPPLSRLGVSSAIVNMWCQAGTGKVRSRIDRF